jgi:parallel beta-helix repeat protein
MRRSLSIFVASLILIFAILIVAQAATITVDDSGGADHTTIQAAVDAATPGDTITVAAGTYNENVTIWKPLTIIGSGPDTCFVDAGGSGSTFLLTGNFINITGFNITGSGSGATDAGVMITGSDCWVNNTNSSLCQYGVLIDNGNRNIISNGSFYMNTDDGVSITSTAVNCVVKSSVCINNGDDGISANGGCSGTIIRNNYCLMNDDEGILVMTSSSSSSIDRNQVHYNADRGISVVDSSHNCYITNNSCSNQEHGIMLVMGINSYVFNNTCTWNNKGGITTSGTLTGSNLTGNTAHNNYRGIYSDGDSYIIHGNNASNNAFGIMHTPPVSSGLTIMQENEFYGNYDGIYIGDGDVKIQHNRIEKNGRNGINLASPDDVDILNNDIKDNKIGIMLYTDWSSGIISQNEIYSNSEYAIEMRYDAASDGFDIYHNNIYGNNGGGVQALDNTTVVDWDNGAEGNFWSDWTTPDTDYNGIFTI